MARNKYLRKLWYALSSKQRMQVRRLYHLPVDLLDSVMGKRHRYVPPRGMIFTGSAAGAQEYLEQGHYQVQLLKRTTDLLPTHDVLDIGSGVGRTAAGLTEIIAPPGSYCGFDIIEKAVDWCNSRIGKDHAHFRFDHVPLHNDLYTAQGQDASQFTFPYQDNNFDRIFSFSVFTHMLATEVDRYLSEIARTLRPDGVAMSTFFVYGPEEEQEVAQNDRFAFPVVGDGFRLMDENVKGGNIAFAKAYLDQVMEKNGLKITSYVPGYWRPGLDDTTGEYQDVVVFKHR